MTKRDQTVLQSITSLVVVAAALREEIRTFLAALFPGAPVVLPVGVWLLLYRLLVFGYDKLLWSRVHKSDYLGGRWVYGIHNHYTGRHLYGVFQVKHGLEGVCVREGAVWFRDGPPSRENQRGTWRSTSAVAQEDYFQFVFDLKSLVPESVSGPEMDVLGIILLNVERESGRPVLMAGHFYDLRDRSQHHGTLEARRVEARTREQHIATARSLYGHQPQPTIRRPAAGE